MMPGVVEGDMMGGGDLVYDGAIDRYLECSMPRRRHAVVEVDGINSTHLE